MRTPGLVGIAMVTAVVTSSPAMSQRLATPPPPPSMTPSTNGQLTMPPRPGVLFSAPMQQPDGIRAHGRWHGHDREKDGRRNGNRDDRWGGRIDGYWSGGVNAPGGWQAYHRPSRGWILPPYWIAPSFFIDNFDSYGLAPPHDGYRWSRYYDDAVMIDEHGRVWDSVNGIDWDSSAYGGRTDSFSSEKYRRDIPYNGPQMAYRGPFGATGGSYTTTTTYAGGGYAAGGYWYPPATTTTVVIQSAPIVTTTTTEYVDVVKARYSAVRRVWRAPVRHWHPPVCHRAREKPIRGS